MATDNFAIPLPSDFDESLLDPLQLDVDMYPFVKEYMVLQQNLSKSRQGQQQWRLTCDNLVKAVKQTELEGQHFDKTHQDAKENQKKLEEQILGTRDALEQTQADMKSSKGTVKELREDIKALEEALSSSAQEMERERNARVSQLENEIEQLRQQEAERQEKLTELRTKNVDLHERHHKAVQRLSALEQQIASLKSEELEHKAQVSIQRRRCEDLERQIKDAQAEMSERAEKINAIKEQISKASDGVETVTGQLRQTVQFITEHTNRYEELNASVGAHKKSLEALQQENAATDSYVKKQHQLLADGQEELRVLRKGIRAKAKKYEACVKKVVALQREVQEQELEKKKWQGQVALVKEEQLALQIRLNNAGKEMTTCIREREVLNQRRLMKLDAVQRAEQAVHVSRSSLKHVRHEFQALHSSIRHLEAFLDRLRMQTEKHERELHRRQQEQRHEEEKALQKEQEKARIQRQIWETEAKLRQKLNTLDGVRGDKNLFRKKLASQRAEMKDHKDRFHTLTAQIQRLKQENHDKSLSYLSEDVFHDHVKTDISALKSNVEHAKDRLVGMKQEIRKRSEQIVKLSSIINDADEELKLQTKQYNAVVNEQRVLNQQLVKRNEELADLYEQLKLQQSVLLKGQENYRDKRRLVRNLTDTVAHLKKQLDAMNVDQSDYKELQETINLTKQAIINEQLKVSALTEELKKSINIHRWRTLMDTDTATYSKIKRVHALQKQIISKSTAVERKDSLIQEREKLYVDLRRVLARQPGAEAVEQLQVYEQTLKEKRSKFRQIQAELRMYQARVEEYQFDLDKLNNDLRLLKLEYFSKRRAAGRRRKTGSKPEPDLPKPGASDPVYGDVADLDLPPVEDLPPPPIDLASVTSSRNGSVKGSRPASAAGPPSGSARSSTPLKKPKGLDPLPVTPKAPVASPQSAGGPGNAGSGAPRRLSPVDLGAMDASNKARDTAATPAAAPSSGASGGGPR